MGILFSDIYKKAIALFDDPKITRAYETNQLQFYKLMYTYLQNAIAMFDNPLSVSLRLSNYKEPNGTMEVFDGDGVNKVFTLDPDFEILDNSVYYYIEGEAVVQAKLDKENRTVEFPDVIPEGQQYSIEQYYIGEFTDEFKDFNNNAQGSNAVAIGYIKDILARLLVKAWAEEERNMLLDIRNIMQDSDFKIMSNDRILKAKNEWIAQMNEEIATYQGRLAWMIRFMRGSSYLGRG